MLTRTRQSVTRSVARVQAVGRRNSSSTSLQHVIRRTGRQQVGLQNLSSSFWHNMRPTDHRCFSNEISNKILEEETPPTIAHDDPLLEETARILDLFETRSYERAKIEQKTIDSLMEQWVERAASDGGLWAAEKSHELLKALESNFDNNDGSDSALVPDAALYNFVLRAFASCQGRQESARAASRLLDRMLSRCRENALQRLGSPAPTTKTFNVALNAWAKSKSEQAGKRAEDIFAQMEDWLLECRRLSLPEASPNGRTLCAVMDAWAQSGAFDAAERVNAILEVAIERQKKSLEEGYTSEDVIMKPDVVMFNTAIHAWANSEKGKGKDKYGAKKAEQVLELMAELNESGELGPRTEHDEDDAGLAPNTRSFTMLVNAWAENVRYERSGQNAEHAEAILNDMIVRYREKGEDVKPNTMTFTACIKAWSKSVSHPDFANRAQVIFHRMADLYRETHDEDFKPNVWAGNALISAWVRSLTEDSAERAEGVLESMQEFCQPDLYSYNHVIDAYVKKRDALRALAVLKKLENSSALQPDIVSYNTALQALSKDRRSAPEAQALLDRMVADGHVRPDRVSYTCLINAWGVSSDYKENGALNAAVILDGMLREYKEGNERLKPDVITFTSAINASANARGGAQQKRAAIKFAIMTLEQMKQSPDFDEPNHMTYSAMMKTCSRNSTGIAERIRLLVGVFQQSRDAGMLNGMALDMFKKGVPPSVQQDYSVRDIQPAVPEAWCRNVRLADRPRII